MPGSYLTLALMLLAMGALGVAAVVFLMAMALLRPPRMTDGKAVWLYKRLSPADLGLAYEEMRFNIRDERTGRPLRIAGWWMPHQAANGRCVLLLHDYGDAKVGIISWAPMWHSLGYNVLAIDLRAHGESEGKLSAGGYWERHDVDQVVNDLRATKPSETNRLLLFGEGLGATTAIAAAALRDDIVMVIASQPPADAWRSAIRQLPQTQATGALLEEMAIRFARKIGRCTIDATAELPLPTRTCPVVLLSPERGDARALDIECQTLDPEPPSIFQENGCSSIQDCLKMVHISQAN